MDKTQINDKAREIYRSLIPVADVIPSLDIFERIALQMFAEGYKYAYEDANAKAYDHALDEVQKVENIEIADAQFEEFWELYDKKRNRAACLKKWRSISSTDRQKILTYIPFYKAAQPDKLYRKDPITFLRQKAWLDEIIPSKNAEREFGKERRSAEAKQLAQALLNIGLE